MSDLKRFKIIIEYEGTHYLGWQKQKHFPNTIQETIEDAIHAFSQQRVEVFGSGRTDSGVHAIGQVAHFDLDFSHKSYETDKIKAAINAHLLDKKISILKIEEIHSDFHARYDAKQRSYKYVILNRYSPPTFNKNIVTHIKYPLDVSKIKRVSKLLIGTHDLTSFRAADCQAKSPVKTIDEINITQEGELIIFHIKARSFLYNQIRNMVGTFCKIGTGKWPTSKMQEILEAKDRTKAGPTAPPQGLFFLEATY